MTNDRSYALDLFRGLTILAMILVNNPGSWSHLYAPLAHADWHGWTVTDLIFPFFLIIVGIAIQFSFASGSKAKLSTARQHREIIIRSLKLYGLGLFLALFYYQFHNPDYSWLEERLTQVRLVGVLQRIALVYLCSALLFIHFGRRALGLIFVALLVFYWLQMLVLPYPLPDGIWTSGELTPGNNLAAYVDHQLFGPKHLYLAGTQPYASDPEGLLTTLPAIASCLGGFYIAQIMQVQRQPLDRIRLLSYSGAFALLIAYILSYWIPFNKNLWTPSYVFLAHGLASLILALLILIADYKQWRKGTKPLVVFGVNAIALFMISGIVARLFMMIRVGDQSFKGWLFQFFERLPVSSESQSLLFACSFLLLMYLPLSWMYKRRIFWKV